MSLLCKSLLFILVVLAGASCSNSAADTAKDDVPAQLPLSSPSGYNLKQPQIKKLPVYLDEISGLAYYAKDNSVFAITDESGIIFKIHLNNERIDKWEFGDKKDYEDLVLVDSAFYVVTSKGKLLSFSFSGNKVVNKQEFDLSLSGKNEFEILFTDKQKQRLIAMCKNCEADNKSRLSAFAFSLRNKIYDSTSLLLNVDAIAKKAGLEKLKFKPSAAAFHPLTGELFIVSSINKMLVVTDSAFSIKSVHGLDAALFKQPEGIAFSPLGDMYISNESAEAGAANILIFKYKRE